MKQQLKTVIKQIGVVDKVLQEEKVNTALFVWSERYVWAEEGGLDM